MIVLKKNIFCKLPFFYLTDELIGASESVQSMTGCETVQLYWHSVNVALKSIKMLL